MLTLYYTPGACSMAAHIVLEESGDEYEARKVDLAGGEQRTEAYLKINPLGRSPRGASAPRRSDEANHRSGDPSLPAAPTVDEADAACFIIRRPQRTAARLRLFPEEWGGWNGAPLGTTPVSNRG